MREGVETALAVITAHTRITNTAKWQRLIRDMHYNIVYAGSTRRCSCQNTLPLRLRAEVVERKRFFALVDKRYSLLGGVKSEHREYWTKNLLLHHRRIGRNIVKQSRLDIPLLSITLSSKENCATFQVSDQPLKCLIIYDADKVLVLLWFSAKKRGELGVQLFCKPLFNILMHKQIVGVIQV